jgi:hypothetical protein
MLNKLLDNDFWFGTIRVESLCLYRIGLGLLLCAETLNWLPYTTELFSNQGFHLGPLSGFALPPFLAKLLCLILIVSSFSIAAGFKTRASLLITLLIWSYFFFLDQISEKALHSIVIINLIILIFSSCQSRLSLDDLLRQKKGQGRLPETTPAWTLRLLQIQIVQVYFFSGLVKLASNSWTSGSVLKQIFTSRWATDWGAALGSAIPDAGFYIMAVSIIMYELFAGFLLFIPRVRGYVICFGIIFHLMSFLTLYVGYLALHYIFSLVILFIEPARVSNLLKKFFPKSEYLKNA